ncbi:hypothetical protein Bbelb_119720, partial [Branchiostoma belcheri]
GLISRERETRPETCIGLLGPTPRRLPPDLASSNCMCTASLIFLCGLRDSWSDRPMQVSGLVSREREIRPLREQDGLIAIENLEDELHRLWRDHIGIRPRYAGRGAPASRLGSAADKAVTWTWGMVGK